MKTYEVSLYTEIGEVFIVEAKNEKQAKKKALALSAYELAGGLETVHRDFDFVDCQEVAA